MANASSSARNRAGCAQFRDATGGCGRRSAGIVRHTYEIGPGRFSIRKEVQFEGAGEFLERNRYVWTR